MLPIGRLVHLYLPADHGPILFPSDAHYRVALELLGKWVLPVANIWAYCLLPNHFHLLIEIRTAWVDRALARWLADFSAETVRQSPLITSPFSRRPIQEAHHLPALICYIHRNPQQHGYTPHFTQWPWSSYHALLQQTPSTQLASSAVLSAFFQNHEWFEMYHWQFSAEMQIAPLIQDD